MIWSRCLSLVFSSVRFSSSLEQNPQSRRLSSRGYLSTKCIPQITSYSTQNLFPHQQPRITKTISLQFSCTFCWHSWFSLEIGFTFVFFVFQLTESFFGCSLSFWRLMPQFLKINSYSCTQIWNLKTKSENFPLPYFQKNMLVVFFYTALIYLQKRLLGA